MSIGLRRLFLSLRVFYAVYVVHVLKTACMPEDTAAWWEKKKVAVRPSISRLEYAYFCVLHTELILRF